MRYWQGFLHCHSHLSTIKRGQCFASDSADWSKKSYIRQMYDSIYNTYIEAIVAKALDSPVFQNIHDNLVSENKYYGELIDIEILHPKYILFANKTGLNTLSWDNRNEGGTKIIYSKGQVPKRKSTTSGHCCTVL